MSPVRTDQQEYKINLKVFHCEIQNNQEAIKKEEKRYKPIPVIEPVTAEIILKN